MKIKEINSIKKPYFGYEDISRALGINLASARVSATRYVKQDLLIRPKRGLYILSNQWAKLALEDKFKLSNLLQTPSYISFLTAISYYGITTQIQQNFIEAISINRTKEINIVGQIFNFSRIKEDLYIEFNREEGFFIATPEKAIVDILYFMTLNKYICDFSAINLKRLNKEKVFKLAAKASKKTKTLAVKLWKI